MPNKAGFVAIVLDDQSSQMVQRWAVHPKVHATHITLAHKPKIEVYEKYQKHLGKTVYLEVGPTMAVDCKGQAARVKLVGVPCEKKHPHITISTLEDVPPRYSDELLDNPAAPQVEMGHRKPIDGALEYPRVKGTIQFISFKDR